MANTIKPITKGENVLIIDTITTREFLKEEGNKAYINVNDVEYEIVSNGIVDGYHTCSFTGNTKANEVNVINPLHRKEFTTFDTDTCVLLKKVDAEKIEKSIEAIKVKDNDKYYKVWRVDGVTHAMPYIANIKFVICMG